MIKLISITARQTFFFMAKYRRLARPEIVADCWRNQRFHVLTRLVIDRLVIERYLLTRFSFCEFRWLEFFSTHARLRQQFLKHETKPPRTII